MNKVPVVPKVPRVAVPEVPRVPGSIEESATNGLNSNPRNLLNLRNH
jgi:hypothetical protein